VIDVYTRDSAQEQLAHSLGESLDVSGDATNVFRCQLWMAIALRILGLLDSPADRVELGFNLKIVISVAAAMNGKPHGLAIFIIERQDKSLFR
jgi:hypothetical protein